MVWFIKNLLITFLSAQSEDDIGPVEKKVGFSRQIKMLKNY